MLALLMFLQSKELGYMPARHEVFIAAHTRKDGTEQVEAANLIVSNLSKLKAYRTAELLRGRSP